MIRLDLAAVAAHLALAKRQGVQIRTGLLTHPCTTRIAHRHRLALGKSRAQQLAAFRLICRAGNRHVRNAAGKGNVVIAGVGGPVRPDQPCPVQRKDHGQVLQGHIVQHLVVRPLQKSGVNGDHGLEPLAGQPGGKGDGVLLGNAYVEIAVGKALVKFDHARAFAHGGRNAHQPNVAFGHIAQPLPKHLGKGGFGWRSRWLQTRGHIEFTRPVVGDGVGLCLRIALAFAGDHVQKLRPFEVAHVL